MRHVASSRLGLLGALGLAQIFAFGSSYYLLAVLASPISADTGWPLTTVVAGLSVALLAAGVVSPAMGRWIGREGGRRPLSASALLLAAGLAVVAVSGHYALFLLGWAIIGIGMGFGIYDAAFATLGRQLGQASRSAITALTLIAGFASTLTWPLSAYLMELVGWRGTCLAYAAIELALCLPLYLVSVPSPPPEIMATVATGPTTALREEPRASWIFYTLGVVVSLIAAITSIMAVQLLAILAALGFDQVAAVALGTLLGPAQVAFRMAEMAFGRRFHPTITMTIATALVVAGLALFQFDARAATLAIILYGGGIGISSVARGTVPMAVFGPGSYAVRMGQLALPALVAQAVAPIATAFALEGWSASVTLAALLGIACIAFLFSLPLAWSYGLRKNRAGPPPPGV